MLRLVLLRHGESTWNKENRFTGWTDVDLNDNGREEARRAGQLLAAEKHEFDVAYTSVLKRAIRTLWIALDELDMMWIPVHKSWRLERASLWRPAGAEQGRNGGQALRGLRSRSGVAATTSRRLPFSRTIRATRHTIGDTRTSPRISSPSVSH